MTHRFAITIFIRLLFLLFNLFVDITIKFALFSNSCMLHKHSYEYDRNKKMYTNYFSYQKVRLFDAPVRALQCIDVVLKDAYQLSTGVQVGRSFFTRPNKPFNLGDFYELWTGLFQSTVLGSIPYVNVDIAHKAFPQAMHVMDVIYSICQNRLNETTTLENWPANILLKHLKGLRIIYTMPGSDASKKCYKFLGLANSSRKEMFLSDGQNISVYDYFQSRNYTIRFPNLPCLKVGSSIRSISLPPELCSIPPGQVSIEWF